MKLFLATDTPKALLLMTLPKPQLLDLPDEILSLILSHVSGVDLVRLSGVCRRMHALTRRSELWRAACLSEPGLHVERMVLESTEMKVGTNFWRTCFQQFHCRSIKQTCPGCLKQCEEASLDATTIPICRFVLTSDHD